MIANQQLVAPGFEFHWKHFIYFIVTFKLVASQTKHRSCVHCQKWITSWHKIFCECWNVQLLFGELLFQLFFDSCFVLHIVWLVCYCNAGSGLESNASREEVERWQHFARCASERQ